MAAMAVVEDQAGRCLDYPNVNYECLLDVRVVHARVCTLLCACFVHGTCRALSDGVLPSPAL